jgi:hypothetical protein
MTNEPDARDLFNPFMLWTDLGMRAAEVAVASAQNMTEGADRLTRAAASAEADADDTDDDEASGADDKTNTWASASLGGMADMQRMMWDLTTRSWVQWMSMASNLMSAGAGVGLARTVAHQRNPLKVVRGNIEHALAAPEPKSRRKAPAKRRTSQKR